MAEVTRRGLRATGNRLREQSRRRQPVSAVSIYLASEGKLMAVQVKDDVAMSLGETTALFPTELPTGTLAIPVVAGFPYDVADNGQRFLLITPIQSAITSGSAAAAPSVPFTAILDWTSLLPEK
jgi:hypothetical protein